jgi:hypothetical protein
MTGSVAGVPDWITGSGTADGVGGAWARASAAHPTNTTPSVKAAGP